MSTGRRYRICIVTPGYISSTPRVVREANALSNVGYDVRVVFTQGSLENIREFDDDILAAAPWAADIVRWSRHRPEERVLFAYSRLRQRSASLLSRIVPARGAVARAEGQLFPELAQLAARQSADLFIGHYPGGLAAAAAAAATHGAHLGFDVEDLYADTHVAAVTPVVKQRIVDIERRYLPHCAYVSAVSGPVAAEFAMRYGVSTPVVVHNCCEIAERPVDVSPVEPTSGISAYWFSQTVGLDRGIQDAVLAAARTTQPVHLHLRGYASDEVRRDLESLASSAGFQGHVHFHDRAAAGEMVGLAMRHDVGLALEPGNAPNNLLTVSNKLFTYLMAGNAVVAADTPGQRSVMATCRDAGLLYRPGDVETLADQFQRWASDRAALDAAKTAALEAARTRWNAAIDMRNLVDVVAATLEQPVRRVKPA